MSDQPNPDLTLAAARWQQLKPLLADALELPPQARSAHLDRVCGSDAALRAELESLLDAAGATRTPLDASPADAMLHALAGQASTPAADRSGHRMGAYRLTSLIARGGMGEVYRAARDDGQYEQQVAVKIVRAGGDTAFLLDRFHAERRILATLDHPNLAKLLDAGISPEGAHYVVMDLVDGGQPIDAYCERHQLPLDARLRLFRTVCQVVDYAHRQGVVHRDLKPGNILVTRDGVVKLVDFGIAKRLDPARDHPSAADITATAQRALTPEYASPEQVRGEPVTPASDIYALGVVLYRLLTQASPYGPATGDHYALTRAICDTEPAPPSRADTTAPRGALRPLRGDLDAIVLMALRKDPAHRYASAEALADDVFRHLEGLPVQARRGAWSYRAGRFVLRHRAAFGAVLLANLALLAGIAFAGYQAYEAHRQRERAQHHFASVRKLANVMLVDLHTAIRTLPGSTPARKLLVEKGLAYLEELGAEARDDRGLQVELATGYRNIGDIQGRPGLANLGDPQGALKSYARASTLLAPVLADSRRQDATYRNAQQEQAVLSQRAGAVLGFTGQFKEAEATLRAGLPVADALAAADPHNRLRQLLRATLYGQLSQVQMFAGDIDGFLKTSAIAAGQLEALVAQDPNDNDAGLNLATNYADLGEQLIQRDTTAESARLALDAFRKSLAVLERLHAKSPQNTSLTRHIAVNLENVAWALRRTGQPRDSVASMQRALALMQGLVTQDPSNAQFRADLASAQGSLGESLLAAGDAQASVEVLTHAVATFESLPAGALEDSYVRYHQALTYHVLGLALAARGQRADARAACARQRQALPLLEALDKQGIPPGDTGPAAVREALARCA
ncbi:MAG: serine/threonine protein kinase [Rhizobacter sp.]|nr:serine/threonine protein kinase [Rhizobacter sp.]